MLVPSEKLDAAQIKWTQQFDTEKLWLLFSIHYPFQKIPSTGNLDSSLPVWLVWFHMKDFKKTVLSEELDPELHSFFHFLYVIFLYSTDRNDTFKISTWRKEHGQNAPNLHESGMAGMESEARKAAKKEIYYMDSWPNAYCH